MRKTALHDLFDGKFHPWVSLVYQLSTIYLYAVAVILDSTALLQAVKQHFEAVIQVRHHVLIIYINAQLEVAAYHLIAKRTLKIECPLVILYRLRLTERTVTDNRNYLVTVSLARYLAAYNYLFHISKSLNQTRHPLSLRVG